MIERKRLNWVMDYSLIHFDYLDGTTKSLKWKWGSWMKFIQRRADGAGKSLVCNDLRMCGRFRIILAVNALRDNQGKLLKSIVSWLHKLHFRDLLVVNEMSKQRLWTNLFLNLLAWLMDELLMSYWLFAPSRCAKKRSAIRFFLPASISQLLTEFHFLSVTCPSIHWCLHSSQLVRRGLEAKTS